MGSAILYRCDKCGEEFTSLETLQEHKAIVVKIRNKMTLKQES